MKAASSLPRVARVRSFLLNQFNSYFPNRNAEHSVEDLMKYMTLEKNSKAIIYNPHHKNKNFQMKKYLKNCNFSCFARIENIKSIETNENKTNENKINENKSIENNESLFLMKKSQFIYVIHKIFVENFPLEYLVNTCFFYERPFFVNKHVLICRQDTEVLIDCFKDYFKKYEEQNSNHDIKTQDASSQSIQSNVTSNFSKGNFLAEALLQEYINTHFVTRCNDYHNIIFPQPRYVIDLCSGSGCILLTALLETPSIEKAIGVEISQKAIQVAKINTKKLLQNENIITFVKNPEWIQANVFEYIKNHIYEKADYILSNPPYIATSEISTLDCEVKDYEPRIALDGGTSGLDFYSFYADNLHLLLRVGGILILEIGVNQSTDIKNLFLKHSHWKWIETRKDWSEIDRIICFQRIQ